MPSYLRSMHTFPQATQEYGLYSYNVKEAQRCHDIRVRLWSPLKIIEKHKDPIKEFRKFVIIEYILLVLSSEFEVAFPNPFF